jgi:hypothetical protein
MRININLLGKKLNIQLETSLGTFSFSDPIKFPIGL